MYESLDSLTERGSLYEKITRMDLVGKMRPLLEQAGWIVRPDGKIVNPKPQVAWDSPWIHVHQDTINECTVWHSVFFLYFKQVPSYCMDCWKVCVSPRNVEELFNLYEIQKSFGHPSKCGIEIRATNSKLYGGYFYNKNLEDGRKCYEEVRKLIDPEIPAVLKNGCTEFELRFNKPPCEAEPTEDQLWIEKWVRQWVIIPQEIFAQPQHLQAYIMKKWLHYAASHGDETHKIFNNGRSLIKELKTYHKEKENGEVSE
jgi:hypothetical protein